MHIKDKIILGIVGVVSIAFLASPLIAGALTSVPWVTGNNATTTPSRLNGFDPEVRAANFFATSSTGTTATSTFMGYVNVGTSTSPTYSLLVGKMNVYTKTDLYAMDFWSDIGVGIHGVGLTDGGDFRGSGGAGVRGDGSIQGGQFNGGLFGVSITENGAGTINVNSSQFDPAGYNIYADGGYNYFSSFVGIGTTTAGTLLSLGDTGPDTINITPTATSTFGHGLNLRNGCYSINNVCISGSSFTNTLANGGTATTTFYNGGVVFSDATKLTQSAAQANFFWDETNKRLGLGTSTPWAQLSVNPSGIAGPAFAVGSSTGTKLVVLNGGNVGVATSTPYSPLAVTGTTSAAQFDAYGTATSTFNRGLNLAGGCFSIAGTCLSSGGSGTVGSGTTGQYPYYAGAGTTLTATSTPFVSTASQVGIGTVSPTNRLSVNDPNAAQAVFNGFSRIANAASANSGSILLGTNTSFQGVMDYSQAGNTTLTFDNTFDSALAAINFRIRSAGTPVTVASFIGSGQMGIGVAAQTSASLTIAAGANTTPQINAYGWSRVGGASNDNGDIQIGNNASYGGELQFDQAGNTMFAIDNKYDAVGAVTKLRMRVAGTPVEALNIYGSGELKVGGTSPTMGTCGTSPSVSGTDTTGKVTVGAGVVTSCTVNFGTTKVGTPHVIIEVDGATAIAHSISAVSTTAFTVNFAATLGGGTFDYLVVSN